MVSDQEIAEGVEILLSQSDSKSFTTLNDVVHQLGQELGFDLSHKTLFIRDQINLLLLRSRSQSQYHPPPPPQPSISTSGITKDHFALQQQQLAQYHHFSQPHQTQFQHPHFALQQQQHQRQRHPVELNFSTKATPQTVVTSTSSHQSLVHPLPEIKAVRGVVHDAGGKSSEKPKKVGSTGTKRRGGPGGLNKLCGITTELQVIVGESSLSRTDIVKQLWAYIKKNNLQDPGNKRKIICDDALRVVFETDCTDMFKMNKLLAKHIIRLEPTKESSRKRSKVSAEAAAEKHLISEALAKCLGTGEREMSESEALRLVWEYINVNNLEDPENAGMILCDEKLKEVFGCESISAMGIRELLVSHHLFKQQ